MSSLFGEPGLVKTEDRRVVEAFEAAGRTLDDLPYTAEFASLVESLGVRASDARACRDVLTRLQTLRKAGRLPRMGRASSPAPRVDAEAQGVLMELVRARAGSVGQRDQLPYTPAFDEVAQAFSARTGVRLDAHGLWRLVATLAK